MPQTAMSAALSKAFAKLPVEPSPAKPALADTAQTPSAFRATEPRAGIDATPPKRPVGRATATGSKPKRALHRTASPTTERKAKERKANPTRATPEAGPTPAKTRAFGFGRRPRVERDPETIIELIELDASKQDLAELLEIAPQSVMGTLRKLGPAVLAAWNAKHPSARRQVVMKVGANGPGQIVIRYAEALSNPVSLLRAARVLEILAETREADSPGALNDELGEEMDSSASALHESLSAVADDVAANGPSGSDPSGDPSDSRLIWRDVANRCKADRRSPWRRLDAADDESIATMLRANQSVVGMISVLGVEWQVLMNHIQSAPELEALWNARPKTPIDETFEWRLREDAADEWLRSPEAWAAANGAPSFDSRGAARTRPIAARSDGVLAEFEIEAVDRVRVAFLYRDADGKAEGDGSDAKTAPNALAPTASTLREAACRLRALASDLRAREG
ncbi:hypothetical protein [Burkholderia pseudomallei]|uniref:hypothetical protein n=1 Tax=Burkholderia pseudomallei TaxID=28450 RepID=UPI000F0F970D|nr:hypothetical protein [Burkholderia pseudomallei]CAJ3077493.1 Uncharacterised protein [Burkholderia pseudomallei]VCK72447.1 Uncharacterised protein [Burkholderia pseudomallei]VCK79828.1 Uncharacterised protein [Burkholderia pseudomallei]VCK80175.1 Uncharacterised protein [Burkholderia pseudomallei]VCK80639.1 Uncharacterised protein [Burkholderia pseudomallei]